MVQNVVTFGEYVAREEVERVVSETAHHGFPVLRSDESGRTYMVRLYVQCCTSF